MTAVDELKEPDCGNATDETEKDAEVEKSDNVDDDTNNMDKLRSKKKPGSCLMSPRRTEVRLRLTRTFGRSYYKCSLGDITH